MLCRRYYQKNEKPQNGINICKTSERTCVKNFKTQVKKMSKVSEQTPYQRRYVNDK